MEVNKLAPDLKEFPERVRSLWMVQERKDKTWKM